MGAVDSMKEATEGRGDPHYHANNGMPASEALPVATRLGGGRAEPDGTGPKGSASPTGS
jgi:hypothetical protein